MAIKTTERINKLKIEYFLNIKISSPRNPFSDNIINTVTYFPVKLYTMGNSIFL